MTAFELFVEHPALLEVIGFYTCFHIGQKTGRPIAWDACLSVFLHYSSGACADLGASCFASRARIFSTGFVKVV